MLQNTGLASASITGMTSEIALDGKKTVGDAPVSDVKLYSTFHKILNLIKVVQVVQMQVHT